MPAVPTCSAIDLHDVSKVYRGRIHALQGISLAVQRGEIFGLLGPNGAGKSTLIKIMMTVVKPSQARGTILGHPVGSKATLAAVGYLPENHRFPRYLTGRQTLEFFAALSGVDRMTRRRRAAELLDTVGMTSWADSKVGSYSKGMMQRIGLAQALVNDPELVLLDEPTDGVDPVGRRDIRDVLLRMRDRGKTVFINSHLLSELEMVCDRVAILVGGRVARQGTVSELTADDQRYEIEVVPPSGNVDLPRRVLIALFTSHVAEGAGKADVCQGLLPSGVRLDFSAGTIRAATTEAADIQPVVDALRAAGVTIKRVQAVRPSLEQLFMDAVTDSETGKTGAVGAAAPPPVPMQ